MHQAKDNIGRTVTYAYDANGNLTSVTDPMNQVTTYTYDASNRMTGIKPPNLQGTPLNLVTNEYTTAADAPTPAGWVKKQTLADGGVYQFAYLVANGKSTRTDVMDPRGHVRRVTFNDAGYRSSDTWALGEDEEQATNFVVQSGTNFVTSSTDALNRQTTRTYDSKGNVESITRAGTQGEPVTTTYSYEPIFNRIATITDPLNHTTTFGYDAVGNLTSITDPLNHTTTIGYNGAGQRTSIKDALQRTSTFTYEGGNLVKIANALGHESRRFVHSIGRVLSITDPLGRVTRQQYDNAGRVTQMTDALGGITSFAYYPNGRLQTVTDAANNTTSYFYDALERLVTRRDALLREEHFAYDLNGNLVEHVDRNAQVTTRSYDARDRLSEIGYAGGATVAFTYDAVGHATSLADSAAGTITRAYDVLDRLELETTPSGVIGYTYDAADRRVTMTVAGQPSVVYEYDNANRLTQLTRSGATVLFGYDDANRRTTLTQPNGITTQYGYDWASRLTDLTYKLGGTVVGTLIYDYDVAGNRISVDGTFSRTGLPRPVNVAAYDAANQLTSWAGAEVSHDQNGNLSSDGLTSYNWNARNQLIALTGGASASYQYDAVGRRTSRSDGVGTTGFLYDGLDVVQELSGATPTANRLVGESIDEWFSRTDAATRYPVVDALGSTVALIDNGGTVRTEYTYEPFGRSLTIGEGTGNAFQFTGRETDSTGIHYYRARYYSSSLQRFMSEDPLGLATGPNTYEYAASNPLGLIDPFGLAPQCPGCVDMFRECLTDWMLPGFNTVVAGLLEAATVTASVHQYNTAVNHALKRGLTWPQKSSIYRNLMRGFFNVAVREWRCSPDDGNSGRVVLPRSRNERPC